MKDSKNVVYNRLYNDFCTEQLMTKNDPKRRRGMKPRQNVANFLHIFIDFDHQEGRATSPIPSNSELLELTHHAKLCTLEANGSSCGTVGIFGGWPDYTIKIRFWGRGVTLSAQLSTYPLSSNNEIVNYVCLTAQWNEQTTLNIGNSTETKTSCRSTTLYTLKNSVVF